MVTIMITVTVKITISDLQRSNLGLLVSRLHINNKTNFLEKTDAMT